MFKVGQEYLSNNGLRVRIVCNDANFRPLTTIPVCNIIGIVTQTNGVQVVHYYDDEGVYGGVKTNISYIPYSLISDEPNAEEAVLIQEIGSLVEGDVKDREAAMLKIIRKLRTK